jgi:tetratricopeptide (TPR) repeat protein
MALMPNEQEDEARHFRADEELLGTVSRSAAGYALDAELVLPRDTRMVQPMHAEGATVRQAAEALASDAIAARGQMIPLRECENAARDGHFEQAASAAVRGVRAYPNSTLARACLMNALSRMDGEHNDSVVAVARAILRRAPANPIALEYLAVALDAKGDAAGAGDAWVRLLATDSLDETLTRRVVESLAREGNARLAEPLIMRATEAHPDNLELLKLRWLVHLATNNWKAAIATGEKLRELDAASQTDPDFFRRLASAYRADSQPLPALATASFAVTKFPDDAALYSLYVQLLQQESGIAVPRGLARFPESADLHAIAAQSVAEKGDTARAVTDLHAALAANPHLPHGWLQLADYEIALRRPDSAFAALQQALANGEAKGTVAQFALARGNALYTAATGTKQRADFERAHRFLTLAKQLDPSPQASFLLGASALSVSQAAATEAPASKSCALMRLADSTLTEAQENLMSGGSVAPDAAAQFLNYASTLRPFVDNQLKALCQAPGDR